MSGIRKESEATIHAESGYPYSSSAQLSCQVDYLKRSHIWESGILAVPFQIMPDNSRPLGDRVFFDLETYFLPWDLGYSKEYADINRSEVMPKQRLGLAVTINAEGQVECWDECQAKQLVDYLLQYSQVVSYNGLRFDNLVLSAYSSPEQTQQLETKTLDLYVHLQEIRGVNKRLTQWSEQYLGLGNHAKLLISEGFGYEEGKLVKGFDKKNSIPFILREGAAAQKRLVWVACFEDAMQTRSLLTEVNLEQKLGLTPKPDYLV